MPKDLPTSPARLPVIRTSIHLDGGTDVLRFDALDFFETADDVDLVDLALANFTGEKAIEAAVYLSGFKSTPRLTSLMKSRQNTGRKAEVIIFKNDALLWLQTERPEILLEIALVTDTDLIAQIDHNRPAPAWDAPPVRPLMSQYEMAHPLKIGLTIQHGWHP